MRYGSVLKGSRNYNKPYRLSERGQIYLLKTLHFENITKFVLLFYSIVASSILIQNEWNNNQVQDAMTPGQTQELICSYTDHPGDDCRVIEYCID